MYSLRLEEHSTNIFNFKTQEMEKQQGNKEKGAEKKWLEGELNTNIETRRAIRE